MELELIKRHKNAEEFWIDLKSLQSHLLKGVIKNSWNF